MVKEVLLIQSFHELRIRKKVMSWTFDMMCKVLQTYVLQWLKLSGLSVLGGLWYFNNIMKKII